LTKTIGTTISITTSKLKPNINARARVQVGNPKHPFVVPVSRPEGANAFSDNLGTEGSENVCSGEEPHRRV